ncbi:MAG: trehalose-phosphatase [Acidimicrobiia bacterium]
MHDALGPFVEHAARGAVLVDFDGSLAPIVDDPGDAVALPAARDALAALVGRVGLVAVVSGRPVAFLRDALGIDSLTYVGQYGLERWIDGQVVVDPRVERHLRAIDAVATEAEGDLPGVFVERKGSVAVALHWRRRPELAVRAQDWAEENGPASGLELHPGRMVVELRPPIPMDKGKVVEELCAGLEAATFAGDDAGDLAAFDALDRLQAAGRLEVAVRVGVTSVEGPPALLARADVQVDGPEGLAAWLAALGEAIRRAPA